MEWIIKQKEFERIFGEDMVQQNRFISSSKDVNVALDFAIRNQSLMKKNEIQVVFEITSKNGRNISDISKLEIMFTSNTSFRSEKTETTDNDVWGKLTEL